MALGHVFGLSKTRRFISAITEYNVLGAGLPVTSIRAYLGWNSASPHEDKTQLIMVPVTTDGNDLFPVFGGKLPVGVVPEQENVLAYGWPCPIFCDF
jgi:hypothetical protein